MRKAAGFTLIEILVVVGVLGIIMMSVVGVLINSFRAKNRIDLADRVEQSGGLVLNELKSEMINALGTEITCSGDRLTYTNSTNGSTSTIVCYEGVKIASESASGNFDLTGSDIAVSGCSNFVQCNTTTGYDNKVNQINFTFGLMAGDAQAGGEKVINRRFQSSVVVRN